MYPVAEIMAVKEPQLTVPGFLEHVKPPRDYQKRDALFLLLRQRALIGEYPGAGKKIIAIMAALKAFEVGDARSCLVVSLGSDVSQWVEDINEVTDSLIVTQTYRGTPKERERMRGSEVEFRVCSYQTAAADMMHLIHLHQIIILDEISYIKNPESNAQINISGLCAPSIPDHIFSLKRLHTLNESKLVKDEKIDAPRPFPPNITPNLFSHTPAKYVWGLSATPMETSPVDIFSLFLAMFGSHSPLGTNFNAFKRDFCIVNKFNVKVPKGKGRYFKVRVEKVAGAQKDKIPLLKQRIQESYIRHPFEEIEKFLPKLSVLPIWLDMGTRQTNRYTEISDERLIADMAYKEGGKKITEKQVTYALKLFYQLRCCDGLNSLPGQKFHDSIKLQWVMDKLTGEMGGEKVIFFSRFHQPHNDLRTKLDQEGITWVSISGNEDEDAVTAARKAFWDPDGAQICMITEKGRYALNLQCARYGIAYNTLFNPKKLEQLYGRNRRPGGEAAIWYHLLCKDTAEEAQWQLLRSREQEFSEIFGLEEELFASLTPEEQAQIVNHGYGAPR